MSSSSRHILVWQLNCTLASTDCINQVLINQNGNLAHMRIPVQMPNFRYFNCKMNPTSESHHLVIHTWTFMLPLPVLMSQVLLFPSTTLLRYGSLSLTGSFPSSFYLSQSAFGSRQYSYHWSFTGGVLLAAVLQRIQRQWNPLSSQLL